MASRKDDGERVSLYPLDPVEALRALLKVKPDSADDEPPAKPNGNGKRAKPRAKKQAKS
jgi:hypothetical protein